MTHSSESSLEPAQQTFQAVIQPLVDSGEVRAQDLVDATEAVITTDRTPRQRQAMKRVWSAYTGGDPAQLPEV